MAVCRKLPLTPLARIAIMACSGRLRVSVRFLPSCFAIRRKMPALAVAAAVAAVIANALYQCPLVSKSVA